MAPPGPEVWRQRDWNLDTPGSEPLPRSPQLEPFALVDFERARGRGQRNLLEGCVKCPAAVSTVLYVLGEAGLRPYAPHPWPVGVSRALASENGGDGSEKCKWLISR